MCCLLDKNDSAEKKRGDERADGSMMNERTSIISEKKKGVKRGREDILSCLR